MQYESSISYTNTQSKEDSQDNQMWAIAKRRAAFKMSVFIYVVFNSLLQAIWYFSSGYNTYFSPIWPILGWGIGISTQYFRPYHSADIFSAQKEYEKLKNHQQY